jgi:hypothetical protein
MSSTLKVIDEVILETSATTLATRPDSWTSFSPSAWTITDERNIIVNKKSIVNQKTYDLKFLDKRSAFRFYAIKIVDFNCKNWLKSNRRTETENQQTPSKISQNFER